MEMFIILVVCNIENELYCKNVLPVKLIDVIYLQESSNFEQKIGGKICKFVSFHCPVKTKMILKCFWKT